MERMSLGRPKVWRFGLGMGGIWARMRSTYHIEYRPLRHGLERTHKYEPLIWCSVFVHLLEHLAVSRK